jgi:hypothetical protein
MAEPVDMIVPLLREMRAESSAARAENAALHEQTRAMVSQLEKRLGGVEAAQKSIRSAPAADTLLSRILTGEFEERIEALERKVQELEAQK